MYLSRDKKLIFSSSCRYCNKTGYFHYFGATGTRDKILTAFKLLKTEGYFEDAGYGGRDYI